MKLSIITVCFNAGSTIEDAINSVASQSYPDIEYIIVDGGANDGTQDLVKKHADLVTQFISEPDNGIYDAYNKGISLASGDVIGFINADDFFADDHVLEDVAKRFSDPSVDVVFGDLCYVKQDDTDKIVRYWKTSEYEPGKFEQGWCPPHPTFYVRNKVYKRPEGKYDTEFKLAADLEMISRCLVVDKYKSSYIPRVLVKMRLGGATNQSLSNILKQNREIIRALNKNGLKISFLRFLIGKIVSRSTQFITRPST